MDWTYIISPNFNLVCIRAHDLWSDVLTVRRRLGGMRGASIPSGCSNEMLPPRRTIGDDPRRLVDMCRPATPPNILKWK